MMATAMRGPRTAPAIQVLLAGFEDEEDDGEDWEAGKVESIDEVEEGEPSMPLE